MQQLTFSQAKKKGDHITPVLASLHWLPVYYRIKVEVLLFVVKSLNGSAPSYIRDLQQPYPFSRSLRLSDQVLLAVPRSWLTPEGDQACAGAAPRLWNSLPVDIRSAPSTDAFKSRLKTIFIG